MDSLSQRIKCYSLGFVVFMFCFAFFFPDSWSLVENRQRLLAAGWYSRYLIFISQNHGLSPSVGWLGSRMTSMVIGKCLPEHKTLQKHLNCDTRWTRNFPCLSTVSRQFSQTLAIFTPRRGNSNVKKAGCSPEISMSFNAGQRALRNRPHIVIESAVTLVVFFWLYVSRINWQAGKFFIWVQFQTAKKFNWVS